MPEEVEKAFIDMIGFTDEFGIHNGNAKVIVNKDGVFVEYTPVIVEPISMSLVKN